MTGRQEYPSYTALPAEARDVAAECVREAWRTVENGDESAVVVAADIVARLRFIYGENIG